MYGAAGILAAEPDAWTKLAADPRWGAAEVLVASGCIVTKDPAPMLLRVLATPRMRAYFRTGKWPVDPRPDSSGGTHGHIQPNTPAINSA
jgi:hypothetical protein